MYGTYYRLKSSALKQLVSLVPHPAMTAVRNLGTVGSSVCREALFTIGESGNVSREKLILCTFLQMYSLFHSNGWTELRTP